jgi:hypothetical protein
LVGENDSDRDNSANYGARISTTVIDDDEDQQQEENKDDYRMMAVDWLETEPNFLYNEMS